MAAPRSYLNSANTFIVVLCCFLCHFEFEERRLAGSMMIWVVNEPFYFIDEY